MPVEMPEAYADDLRLSTEREEMMAMDRIDKFDGEFRFLSNFWSAAVHIPGDDFPDTYRTVEHAYQAAKTLDRKERRAIREAETPGEAKALGAVVVLRPAWDDIRVNVMRDLLWEKFNEHPDLRAKLLATGDAEIVEGNTWGDRFWGVDLKTGEGENQLGKLLMETREKIHKQQVAVLYAKRVAPELDLFEDMLKRARIQYSKTVPARTTNVEITVENGDGDGTAVATFGKDGVLLSLEGFGY